MHMWGLVGIGEISVPSSQFFYELKIALKSKGYETTKHSQKPLVELQLSACKHAQWEPNNTHCMQSCTAARFLNRILPVRQTLVKQ